MAYLATGDPRGEPGPGEFAALCVRTDKTVRLVLKGEIDIATAPRLRLLVGELADANPDPEVIVLDLERVTFIDSAGLHVLFQAHERLNDQLRIAPARALARLLEITSTRDRLPLVVCPAVSVHIKDVSG